MRRYRNRSAAIATAVVMILAGGGTGFSQATREAATTREGTPGPYNDTNLARPAKAEAPHPLAVIFGETARTTAARKALTDRLNKKGYAVLSVSAKSAPAPASATQADRLWKTIEAVAKGEKGLSTERMLLVSAAQSGGAVIALLKRHPDRVAGAVFLSSAPIEPTAEVMRVWAPGEAMRKRPVWVTAPGRAAKLGGLDLRLWRRVQLAAPKAPIALDVHMDQAGDVLSPGRRFDAWLEAVAQGKTPKAFEDAQTAAERKLYAPHAERLKEAWDRLEAAKAGETFARTAEVGPAKLRLSVTAPHGWKRDERGEKKDALQIYVTPTKRGPLFARSGVVGFKGSAAGHMQTFLRRMREADYLVIRLADWRLGEDGAAVAEVLAVGRLVGGKWRRWLVLAVTTGAAKRQTYAVRHTVMDASPRPDVSRMARAMKRLAAGATVRRAR
jgi:pimeloyl-ACP methyl ester carboxylesterase